MKKIISSILILTFIFFSGQIIAQKTNDHGGSKVKKEQKELKNNTSDKSKGKTNDKGGSDVKKDQKGNHNNKPVVDDKTKKNKKENKDKGNKDKKNKDKGNKNKGNKDKQKEKKVKKEEKLTPDEKVEKAHNNIQNAREKVAKAYQHLEYLKVTGKISEEQYLKRKTKIEELEKQLNELEKQNKQLKKAKKEKNKIKED